MCPLHLEHGVLGPGPPSKLDFLHFGQPQSNSFNILIVDLNLHLGVMMGIDACLFSIHILFPLLSSAPNFSVMFTNGIDLTPNFCNLAPVFLSRSKSVIFLATALDLYIVTRPKIGQ